VAEVVNEIASGVHDRHPKVRGLLIDTNVTRMVVAHQDRLSRFEPHNLELLFVAQPRRGRSKSCSWRRTRHQRTEDRMAA